MQGIRVSCEPPNTGWDTHKKENVTLEFDVHHYKDDGSKWIRLIGGPTGYEEARVDDLRKWAFSMKTRFLELIKGKEIAWAANFGTLSVSCKPTPPSEDEPYGDPGGYAPGWDKLEIPAKEIRKAFKKYNI